MPTPATSLLGSILPRLWPRLWPRLLPRPLRQHLEARRQRARMRRFAWDAVADLLQAAPPELRLAPRWKPVLTDALVVSLVHVDAILARFPAPHFFARALWDQDPIVNAFFATADQLKAYFTAPEAGLERFFHEGDAEMVFFAITAVVERRVIFGARMQGEIILRDERMDSATFRDHRVHQPRGSMEDLMTSLRRGMLRYMASAAIHRLVQEKTRLKHLRETRSLLAAQHQAVKLHAMHGLLGPDKESAAKLTELESLIQDLDKDVAEVKTQLGEPADVLADVAGMLGAPGQFLDARAVCMRLTKDGVILSDRETEQGWMVCYTEIDLGQEHPARAMVLGAVLREEVLGASV